MKALRFSVALAALAIAMPALAQKAPSDKPAAWDVNAPPMKTRAIPIKVEEGTWMNLDVSPDGSRIVFDLLGDIYTMPITGGAATRIAEGLAYEQHPRFSPDGSRIAFTSDRGGGDNIWIMNADGSDKRQLTKESFRLLNNPSWSPDGQYIVARKHFTTGRSLGTGELWLYHVSGGNGVPLVKRPNESHQKELGEPVFAADGAGIYYSKDATPGPIFEYAQNSNAQVFVIDRYDMASGKVERVTGGPGGAARPQPSPDGRYLAFVRRERAKTKLYVRDMQSGQERKIYDDMDRDVQETWAVHGVYPNMGWLPDSKRLVFWAGGKIRSIDVASGQASVIPFSVNDSRTIVDPIRPQKPVAPDLVTVSMPRFASVSPDGSRMVFEALGKLHQQPASGGTAQLLVSNGGSDFELFPSFSRDGSQIVYVSWDDARLGELRVVSAAGGEARTISRTPGHYRRPQFSPDGRSVVYEAGSGGGLTSDAWGVQPGIYLLDIASGQTRRITQEGSEPHFGATGDRVYFSKFAGGKLALVSTDLNGEAERTHASGELVSGYAVAPDGRTLAFRQNYAAFVMPFMAGAVDLGAGKGGGALPAVQVSEGGATFLQWSHGGRQLNWSLGPVVYSADASRAIASGPVGKADAKFAPPKTGVAINVSAPADKPSGTVAFTNARIVTMADDQGGIIERGTVVVRDNRIVAVGANVAVPAGAQTVDVAGKTIIPGLVDAHAHGPQGSDDLVPQQNWSAVAHLAMGVTTIHDPSNSAAEIFPAASYQRVGKYLAPRIFSTGEVVYGAKAAGIFAEIDSLADARAHTTRLKLQGAQSVKNYNQPRREQRQQVVAAAQADGLASVAEGGSLFSQDITIIADGNTTLEHNIPQERLYEDVRSFFAQSKVGYTPTLVVTFGGMGADPYWRSHTDIWQHPILSRHVPRRKLEATSVRREIGPEEDYADTASAREAAELARRGVPVGIGAHGQEEGLASHWELWSFVKGGMTPIEALRTATISGARSLGFDRDIGSIEPGKLADMVVIDGDPVADIRQSDRITHVMLNGRLYEVPTMNETLTGTSKLRKWYWEK
ncbi:amidohydrolase family protein [Blastomonas sp.]|uniref:amidohydrolase family protein n=1 Tax=Blastomonas sp. TaxID=1909299 RepID=UPI00406A7111